MDYEEKQQLGQLIGQLDNAYSSQVYVLPGQGDPKIGQCMARAPALDLTTSLQGDFDPRPDLRDGPWLMEA